MLNKKAVIFISLEATKARFTGENLINKLQDNLDQDNLDQDNLDQHNLDPKYIIKFASYYGEPNIKSVCQELRNTNYTEVIIIPLYPQYALDFSKIIIDKCLTEIYNYLKFSKIQVLTDYYIEDFYIQPTAELIQANLPKNFNKILFCYNSLSTTQLQKTEFKKAICAQDTACPEISLNNRFCYRAQCYATSRRLAQVLNLDQRQYLVGFYNLNNFYNKFSFKKQIGPELDIDKIFMQLRSENCENIVIACPGLLIFSQEQEAKLNLKITKWQKKWQEAGGKNFTLIPSLNNNSNWILSLGAKINEMSG